MFSQISLKVGMEPRGDCLSQEILPVVLQNTSLFLGDLVSANCDHMLASLWETQRSEDSCFSSKFVCSYVLNNTTKTPLCEMFPNFA